MRLFSNFFIPQTCCNYWFISVFSGSVPLTSTQREIYSSLWLCFMFSCAAHTYRGILQPPFYSVSHAFFFFFFLFWENRNASQWGWIISHPGTELWFLSNRTEVWIHKKILGHKNTCIFHKRQIMESVSERDSSDIFFCAEHTMHISWQKNVFSPPALSMHRLKRDPALFIHQEMWESGGTHLRPDC